MGVKNYHRDEVYLANQEQFRNIFQVTFQKVSRYKKRGRVLEIGSSTGLLLKQFKDADWKVQGIEPSRKSSSYSIKIGIPTIATTFEKANLKEKYDVIVLNHALEHMVKPEWVLEKIHKLLKNRGIVVINVPNAGGLTAGIYGKYWEYLLPDEHLWQFTPKALFNLLNNTGFRVLEWDAKSGIWEYDNPLLELWQSFTSLKKRFFRNFLTAIPSWFVTQFRMGTGLSVVAQKI